MSENQKLGIKIAVALLLMAIILMGCAWQERSVSPLATQVVTKTLSPSPTQTRTHTPTETATLFLTNTPLPTEFYGTLTFQADERPSSYLLPSDIDNEIAQLIRFALETRLGRSPHRGEQFFSYVLLQPVEQAEDGSLKAYLYVRDRAYYVEQGQLKEGGGGDIPAALHMMPTENGWHVEVETPIPGQWGSSIREIFSEELWPLIFHSPPIPYKALDAQIIQQAEAHFGLVFDPLKNSFPPAEKTPTPAFRILTLTPTPTVDISVLAADVSGHVIVNLEQISISVDLYPSVSRPFQKGLLSADWHIDIFPRGDDQDLLNLDARKNKSGYTGRYEFYVQLTPDELQQRFGDRRGFVCQITDAAGDIFWQNDIYLDAGLSRTYIDQPEKDFANDYAKDVHAGLIVGKPNLWSGLISPVFLPGEKFIVVTEPPGGFYALTYQYALAVALGLMATDNVAQLSDRLVFELFPYLEDGLYVEAEAERLSGTLSGVSGILDVHFPYEWLEQVRQHERKYILRIGDLDGNIYQEAYLWFVPFVP